MLYAIFATDNKNSLTKRQQARAKHLTRLTKLQQQNKLIIAGPHPLINEAGFSGSLIIAKFDSLLSAKKWADDDPYFKSGAYKSVTVKPFKKILPKN